jgi:hypothetical protein
MVFPSRGIVNFCCRTHQVEWHQERRARELEHARLLALLDYDKETGFFTWRTGAEYAGKRLPGARAGHQGWKGYRYVTIDGSEYSEHRLAWFYVRGEWPPDQIDHKDLNRSRNVFDNLRCADNQRNQWNTRAKRTSKTGVKGVWFKDGHYTACLMIDGEKRHLGKFPSVEAAAEAYAEAVTRLRGEFARAA